ncbi:MAG: lipid II flippase MurJ [Candidatus Peribacteraceae bacterium]|nr:lipid II flippase MurJ [Candidatus Peribacteraceae bacterium]
MRVSLPSSLAQHRILGGAAVLAVTQFTASAAGLLRDRLLSQTFPGLDTVDVYIAAFRPSDLLFQIFIMAGFSVALVPLLARYHAEGDTRQMSGLLNGVVAVAAVLFGVIALLLCLSFRVIAPAFTQFQGESLELYIRFARIALLTNFLFVFGNAYGQYLNTIQRFWMYGLTPVLYTVGTILGTAFLTPLIGPYGPIIGTLAGAVVYVLLRLFAILRSGYRLAWRWWHPDLKDMGLLMIPRMLALGALQLELLVFDRVASGLPAGSVTVNAFARNFQAVVVGVTGMALALSLFSPLSQAAAQQDWKRFRLYVKRGILFMLTFTIPASIALVLLTPVAVWLIHLASAYVALFFTCLCLYAVSIPFESMNHLFTRAYFAAKHTTIPAILTVINGALAIALSWLLAPRFGVFSLAFGYSIGHIAEMVGLLFFLPGGTRVRKTEF